MASSNFDLNPDHTVLRLTMIGTGNNGEDTVGGLASPTHREDVFGCSLGRLGDLDGDGVPDLIVGARGDDDGGKDRGALYVLFMLGTGSVKTQQKISSTQGGLGLSSYDLVRFGSAVGVVGEVDRKTNGGGGGVDVVAGDARNAFFLRLGLDGTLESAKHLKEMSAPRESILNTLSAVAGVGDVDGNGVVNVVVGGDTTPLDHLKGAVYVLLMERGGRILRDQKISSAEGGMTSLTTGARFGFSVAGLGDLDGDGTPDLAVGAPGTSHSSNFLVTAGVVYILLLEKHGGVKGSSIISIAQGGLLAGPLLDGDQFGASVATLVRQGESEEDEGVVTLVVGARKDQALVEDGGALYILSRRS